MRISRSLLALLAGGPLALSCGGQTEPGDATEAGSSAPAVLSVCGANSVGAGGAHAGALADDFLLLR